MVAVIHDLLAVAIAAARAGAEQITAFAHGKDKQARMKERGGAVTAADMASERAILAVLKSTGIPIISEETQHAFVDAPLVWTVDPLDGTEGFIEGTPGCTVMIGLLKVGEPVLGVIHDPHTGAVYTAIRGEGAWLHTADGKRRIHCSERGLETWRAVLSKHHRKPKEKAFVEALGITQYETRVGAGSKLCAIAHGNAELYVNTDGLWLWDIVPGALIVHEAGGTLCDKEGKPLVYTSLRVANGVLAWNGTDEERLRASLPL